MEETKQIFESYNMAIEESYNKFFLDNNAEELTKNNEKFALQYVRDGISVWERTQLKEIDNLSPEEYFRKIPDLDTAIETFKLGAKLSDIGLPPSLIEKLRCFGDSAIGALLNIAKDKSIINDEEDCYISIMAIRLIGSWGVSRAARELIEILLGNSEYNELVAEEVCDALVNIGVDCTEVLINTLNDAEKIESTYQHLLEALAKIGKCNKSDAIYQCLKSAFLRMENKSIGAAYLGDYGDSKAIPALRGYLEKSKGDIEYYTFCEIKSAVKRLGGNVDDLER